MKNINCCEISEKILKIFESSIEKFNFKQFLEKLLLKIEPSGKYNFSTTFSNFGGGAVPLPPGGAYRECARKSLFHVQSRWKGDGEIHENFQKANP